MLREGKLVGVLAWLIKGKDVNLPSAIKEANSSMLTPSECVYLNEFIQKGVSKEEVSRVRDALRGKPADFKQLNELYIYYDGLVDVYTKGILSGIVEFGDHERTVYKFRKEFGILVQGYE